jgi:hypothetical protein
VVLDGLQHGVHFGFAEPIKYATCESARLSVDQVIVAVVAVTFVAATLKMGGAVAACPLPANAVIAEAKLRITMHRMFAEMHFDLSIKAPIGDIYTNLFGLLRQSNCIEGLPATK